MIFRAQVIPGNGKATVLWANHLKKIGEELDLVFVLGSLNLVSTFPLWLKPDKADFVFNGVMYWRAVMNGLPVFINRWEGSVVHIFEIVSDHHLRSKFLLQDGDSVVLEISDDLVDRQKGTIIQRALWYLIWWRRERYFYSVDYRRLAQNRRIRKLVRGIEQPK